MIEYLQGILYAVELIVGLGLLIFIHELGHFIMAKRNGVRVEAFSLGMGPILWKRTWNGTEYRISVVPLGGYVKMAGENITDPRTGAPDELTSKSAWQRLQIFAAGAIMNLVIAFPIAIVAFLLGRSVHVNQVAVPGHPETIAGMRPGDTVVEVDGVRIESADQYRREMIRRPEGTMVPVKVQRDEGTVELSIKQSGSERHSGTRAPDTTLYEVRPDSPVPSGRLLSRLVRR
jgi:regulator of sigma E protease